MTRISSNIRTGHGRLWGGLKRAARAGFSIHIPVTGWNKPLFALLYNAHITARESVAWLLRCLWFEPLFRSQCESIGPRFQMERLPYIIGRGRITIGSDVRLSGKSGFGFSSRADTPPRLDIGDGTFIGHDCSFSIAQSVTIGSGCLLAGRVTVRDSDGHPTDFEQRRQKQPSPPEAIRPVVIGDDVWIGAGAVILKGVTIGDRAIVGAGAIVTSDVPEDTIVAGNPARVVKQLPKTSALANEGRAAA